MIIGGHKRLDMIKDRAKFLKFMKDLESYVVEFEGNSTIKAIVYPQNCQTRRRNFRPVIFIPCVECNFLINDGKRFALQMTGDIFLKPKGKSQRIIISDFPPLFG